MPSLTYTLLRDAMVRQKRVACSYNGQARELCPIVLGRSKGEEKVLAYQVGGNTGQGTLQQPQSKCLFVARIRNPHLRDGKWLEGTSHSQKQTCVADVDLDINIHLRKRQ